MQIIKEYHVGLEQIIALSGCQPQNINDLVTGHTDKNTLA